MTRYQIHRPRWSPLPGFDDLRREMDTVFSRFGDATPGTRRGVFPPVNLYQTEDAYVLTAELPGVRAEDLDVSLEGRTLTLRGERRADHTTESGSAHRLERQTGAFRRAVELPEEVVAEKVEAVHRNGVLMLQLPKQPERKPRQIDIQSS